MERPARSGFARVPYMERCAIGTAGSEHAGLICNLSLLGAYVHVDPLPELRDPVSLTFALPDGEPPVRAVASVSWVHDGGNSRPATVPVGFGARFVQLRSREIQRLAALVAGFPGGTGGLFGLSQPYSGRTRIPFASPCVLSAEDRLARGSVCNLSTGGLYFAADDCPEVGRPGIVSLRLPGDEELFERAVIVAWRNPEGPRRSRILPPGCGLRFANLTEQDAARLGALVDLHVGAARRGPA